MYIGLAVATISFLEPLYLFSNLYVGSTNISKINPDLTVIKNCFLQSCSLKLQEIGRTKEVLVSNYRKQEGQRKNKEVVRRELIHGNLYTP